ncbi:uncharacterized protein LOC131638223 [Vicia villosa]|uniref:uncharacterized protein LOC131638223 n=1 Tax=Vicia villosa TaxID=3911 RepID=UPI00273BA4DD|nr:uncharacterized protein LOC131638223 [Vicia villosa]
MPSTRSRSEDLVLPIPEPERSITVSRRLRRTRNVVPTPTSEPVEESTMGEQSRHLKSYVIPSQAEPRNSIAAPAIEANNFELKPTLLSAIQQNQFSGNATEDPNLHLSVFLQYADTVKANNVSAEAIRLRLFPFSLRDRARAWLQSLLANSVTTWNELKKVFLARYFPPSKTAMLRAQINGFRQKENESLFEAWERYKDILRLCPHHGLEEWLIIHTFYIGLLYNMRLTIDAAAGGALMDKAYADAYALIESMAQNHYQWGSERAQSEKISGEKSSTKSGMYEISSLDRVNAKVDALTQKIENLTISPVAAVVAVSPNWKYAGCLDMLPPSAIFWQEFPLNRWKNHPNFSYKNNNALYAPGQAPSVPPGYQKAPFAAPNVPRKSNLELMMENFIATQTQTNKDFINQNVHTNEQIKQLATKVDALATHNKMLETQISQVAQQQAPTAAPARTFPGQPQPNPKGHAHAIIMRSGREMEEPTDPRLKNPAMFQSPRKTTEEESRPKDKPSDPKEKEDKEGKTEEKEAPYIPPPPYKPPIPYPQRLEKSKNIGQFKKFV